ncbi:MAG: hypothetical protein AAF602_30645 [Myxococcota bacterium]
MRAVWASLAGMVACGSGTEHGELGAFGSVRQALLAPCTISTEAGEVASAFGYLLSGDRSCVDGPADLLPTRTRLDCDDFTPATELEQGCFSQRGPDDADLITFHLADVRDDLDLTGASARVLTLDACTEPDEVVIPADVFVVDDDGAFAELWIETPRAAGRVTAEVCR